MCKRAFIPVIAGPEGLQRGAGPKQSFNKWRNYVYCYTFAVKKIASSRSALCPAQLLNDRDEDPFLPTPLLPCAEMILTGTYFIHRIRSIHLYKLHTFIC